MSTERILGTIAIIGWCGAFGFAALHFTHLWRHHR